MATTCSGTSSSLVSPPVLIGGAHFSIGAAVLRPKQTDLEDCRHILISAETEAHSNEVRQQLHVLQGRLPDMFHQPKKPRLRELANVFSVPQRVDAWPSQWMNYSETSRIDSLHAGANRADISILLPTWAAINVPLNIMLSKN